ncbi:MAG: glycosyl hydrolase-related protein [Treponema sp.]|jgi:alpha-mannosidase|nr:glycosyl hydrolase-related protein [Treponema sp.]
MLIPKVTHRIAQYVRFLEKNSYHKLRDLEFEVFETAETFRAPPEEATWQKIAALPYQWGKAWTCSWFKTTFVAPSALTSSAQKGPLFLSIVPNADSLVFIDKKPYGAFNLFHKKLRIPIDGKEHTVHVEAYAGHLYPGCMPFEGQAVFLTIGKTIPKYPNTFEGGALLQRNEAVYSLYYDTRVLFELAATLNDNSLRKARILKELYDALMKIPFSASGEELEKAAVKTAQHIAPLLALKNAPTTPQVHLVGGAHIDHAWLWTIAESERKAARTYSTMLRFIEEYPEFVFIQSQPCQLEIVKKEYPQVFDQIKAAYQKGNWEPNGGMWVEADCNITGGESLIRQFLVGKQVTKELLGYEADTLWLPDVFGYAAALPQILAGCGIRYFVTSKINWNDTTRFPYETFIWRGIDGTGVKTHYISSRMQGYNGKVSPASLAEIWNEVQHKEVQSAVVKPIGEGDGGGGTTREDLEMARRLVDLEGAPRSGWKKVSEALDELFSGDMKNFPEWRGELYLELHRGTYTTQAKTKRYNRKLEFALRNTEVFAAIALLEQGTSYPYDALLRHWKTLLTLQFHDIIPGSSINRVYAEAQAVYKDMEASLTNIGNKRRGILAGNGNESAHANTQLLTLFNDLSWERSDPQVFSTDVLGKSANTVRALKASDGTVYPLCHYTDLDGKEAIAGAPKVPALGWASFSLVKGTDDSPFTYKDRTLITPFYTVYFDEAAHITSLLDTRQNRQLVAPHGCFNRLISAEDVPVLWEAWDVDADWTTYLTEEDRLISTEIIANGPVCFRLRHIYKIGLNSSLTQDVVFYADNPRIDFDTKVSWQETRRLLKVGFDTAIDTTQVRCEVQYGHIIRNTHRNLMQDRAQFEICAHKWISLEEAGHGIGLLNDSKYGHDVNGGCMRLTLLRSPIAPDETADKGEQRFTYALLPFEGAFADAGLVRAGYELNAPLSIVAGGTGQSASFCSIDNAAIILESLKAPESASNGGKRLVLRLYESLGGEAHTTLNFGTRSLVAAWSTDMLEDNAQCIPISGANLALSFRPFEIKTVLLEFC